jgi:hypothetical protein
MILKSHVQYFSEIFPISDFLASPTIRFGVQDIEAGIDFDGQYYAELGQLLSARGITALSLHLYDPRASLHHDANLPVPKSHHGRYKTLIDMGSLEHVFDTR